MPSSCLLLSALSLAANKRTPESEGELQSSTEKLVSIHPFSGHLVVELYILLSVVATVSEPERHRGLRATAVYCCPTQTHADSLPKG